MESIKTLDANALNSWLSLTLPLSILDIRPMSERAEWHIPNSLHLDAYDQFKTGDFSSLDQLFLNPLVPVLTYCGGGKLSLFVAQELAKRGFEAYSLEGGIKAWNYVWNTAEIKCGELTTLIQIRRIAKGCLSYMIGSGYEAMVIDANLDPDVYEQIAQSRGWKIRYVSDSHIHADYVSRSRELATVSGADILLFERAPVGFNFSPVNDGDTINFGYSQVRILHTPDHTDESISFWLNQQALLTGDTLFTDGIGRPDLKADEQTIKLKINDLFNSLQKILLLDPETLILPAHQAKSLTLNQGLIAASLAELQDKIPVLALPRDAFAKNILAKLPPTPPNYLLISSINRDGNHFEHQLSNLEAGGNHCAIQS
jgi:glyoxylase-like metal-dependent hydrolase (beta-lactamase superfamily II)/rhodanese-related sulfurtransferase